MNKCLLCQQNEADKTGSHIIPSFLMKRINGGGKRDKEVGFEIKDGIATPYFGRDIYEDQRKSITDNEEKLYSRENYDIRDHIFCKSCENYFSSLESKYAPSLHLQFPDKSNTLNTKVTSSEAILFWCSLIWRASATKHLGCQLRPDLEERLRTALVNNNIDGLNVHYSLFRCKDFSKNSKLGTIVCMDEKDNSVLLMVDDYMLAMVFDMDKEELGIKLLGINLRLKKENLNDGIKQEGISPIPPEMFSILMESIIQVCIQSMKIPEKLNKIHKTLFKNEIPPEILMEILEMMQNTGKTGDKYTVEHYAWCYKEILKKHELIKENEDKTLTIIQ